MRERLHPDTRDAKTLKRRSAGATAEDGGLCELPASTGPLVEAQPQTPLFPSHQLQPGLSAELEAGGDDVDWFFADDDMGSTSAAAAAAPGGGGVAPVLPECLAAEALLAAVAGAGCVGMAAATVAEHLRGSGDAKARDGGPISPVRAMLPAITWHYIGPAACDFRAACSRDGPVELSCGAAGSVWHRASWRALRRAGAGLHHGKPEMMELALTSAMLLAADVDDDAGGTDSTARHSGSINAEDGRPLPWLDLSQVTVMRMLGGADVATRSQLSSTNGVAEAGPGGGHCVIAGLVLTVAGVGAGTPGQLHSIRAAMRVRKQGVDHPSGGKDMRMEPTVGPVSASAASNTTTHTRLPSNMMDGVCCATVDGAIPNPGDEITQAQVTAILDSRYCNGDSNGDGTGTGCGGGGVGLGLLAASGTVDPQVIQWCAARGVIVLDDMPRHSFHRLVSLCGSRAVHSFRRIKPTHVSQQLMRLELWEDCGWYCGTGPSMDSPEDTAAAAPAAGHSSSRSSMLVVSVAPTQPGQGRGGGGSSSRVFAREARPFVTVVVCASTEAAATVHEAGFWKCMGRLRSTLSTGKVLPGAGCFELHAVEALSRAQQLQQEQYHEHNTQQQQEQHEDTAAEGNADLHAELSGNGNDNGQRQAQALETCLAYGGFARALEHTVQQAMHNCLAPSHAEICSRLDSARTAACVRTDGEGPLQWPGWLASSPLLLPRSQHCDDAMAEHVGDHAGSEGEAWACSDGELLGAATAAQLVLDDFQGKRGTLNRAAEFLRVCLLTDVVNL